MFGMISRFGSLAVIFVFSTLLKPPMDLVGFLKSLLIYFVLIFAFIGIQLLISLFPLMSFGPRKFCRLVFSFPHILVVPVVTPFTFGITCSSQCCCHCCGCCGCSQPRLCLSRPLSLANHLVTLLLMIPPVIFFDFISYWDFGSIQLGIAVLGLVAAPVLLYQPRSAVSGYGGHTVPHHGPGRRMCLQIGTCF